MHVEADGARLGHRHCFQEAAQLDVHGGERQVHLPHRPIVDADHHHVLRDGQGGNLAQQSELQIEPGKLKQAGR